MDFITQGSPEWFEQRIGKFTASEIHKLMTSVKRDMTEAELSEWLKINPKSKAKTIEDHSILSDGAQTYVLEKIAEVLTGTAPEFSNRATDWGNEHEPLAKEMFFIRTGLKINECGFSPYVLFEQHAGGSPDGFIEKDFTVEVKCPFASVNHIQHMLINSDEYFKANFKEYYWQCQANMLFSNRTKCKFISFDPRIWGDQQLFIYELAYDRKAGELIEMKIEKAVELKIELLKKLEQNIRVAA